MKLQIDPDAASSGKVAAQHGATKLRAAIGEKGSATIIVATGASQFDMLDALVHEPDIDWSSVTGFHLDEYLGLTMDHPASFRKYLKERFVDRVPLAEFHYVNGEGNAVAECERLDRLISATSVDVAFIGIGENGHLAFNDPPADFETTKPYLVVDLDEACRNQQLGEGWFPTLEDVPSQAISMSVRQILLSKAIVCTVPDTRKSAAVKTAVEGPVTPELPASILQQHGDTVLFLDEAAASQLSRSS